MRRLTMLATAAAVIFATMPEAYAQSGTPQKTEVSVCERGKPDCIRQDGKSGAPKPAAAANEAQNPDAPTNKPEGKIARAPKAGDSGRDGKPFLRGSDSRFKAPPHGQEYRVVDDRLVLVDSKTLKIVTVLGPENALPK